MTFHSTIGLRQTIDFANKRLQHTLHALRLGHAAIILLDRLYLLLTEKCVAGRGHQIFFWLFVIMVRPIFLEREFLLK